MISRERPGRLNNYNKGAVVQIILPVLIAALIALAVTVAASGARARAIPKMVLATGVDPGFSHFYVAVKAGFLKKHGIHAELKTGPAGGAMVPLVISNQANAATAAALVGINNHVVDPDLVAVAQIVTYDHWFGIVARKSIKTLQDLKGHKIGITRGTASEAFWYAALKHFHLNPADFASGLVNVEAPEMVAAIARGDIDAFVNWEPWISRTLLAEPNTHLLMDNYGILQDAGFIYMNRKWIAKNRNTARRFMRAMLDATKFIHHHPRATKKIDGKLLHLSPQLMNALMPKLKFYLKLDRQSYDIVRFQVDQLKRRGRIKGNFGYDKFFDPELLRAVAPGRVKLPNNMPG